MVQFKASQSLQKHIKTKLYHKDPEINRFDKVLQSPTNGHSRIERTKTGTLIQNYQTQQQTQSNSECPARKMKGRVKFDENLQPQTQQTKKTFKRSFEDQNGSPFEHIHPILACKDGIGEQQTKPQRPSLGYGSSPQASSSSSKYCFSNRSSNLSVKQQPVPESKNHQPLTTQQQKPISSKNLKSNTAVSTQSRKIDKPILQIAPHQIRNNLNRKQSPSHLKSLYPPVINLNIAEEKQNASQKQAIVETPKFNEYYSLIGRHPINQNLLQSSLRSKSLVKGQQIIQDSTSVDKIAQKYYIQDRNSKPIAKDNNSSTSMNEPTCIITNKGLKYDQKRLFLQSHSSCSQRAKDEIATQISVTDTINQPQKKIKMIKLKKSNIKFQLETAQNVRNSQELLNKKEISSIKKKNSSNGLNQNSYGRNDLQIEIVQWSANYAGSGVMIGSPKMHQRQQKAKDEIESSVASSRSSNLSEDESNKIVSQIRSEMRVNEMMASKEALMSYQNYLNKENTIQGPSLSKNVSKERKKNPKKIRKKSNQLNTVIRNINNTASTTNKDAKLKKPILQSFQDKNKIQVPILELSLNENEIEQKFVVQCFDSARVFESAQSTCREMATIQEGGSINKKNQFSPNGDDSYTLAKKEFLQISDEKAEQLLLQNYIDPTHLNFQTINPYQTIIQEFSPCLPSRKKRSIHHNSIDTSTLQTIDSIDKSGVKLVDIIKKSFVHNQQGYNNKFKMRASQVSYQSNIAIEGNLRQINCVGMQKTCEQLFVCSQSMKHVLNYLNLSDMFKLNVILSHKRLSYLRSRNQRLMNSLVLNSLKVATDIIPFWREALSLKNKHDQEWNDFYQCVAFQSSKYDFEIEKDLERTFPHDEVFQKGSFWFNKMHRVLRSVAAFMPHVGYVQGFNFIVGNLLKLLKNEEQVFRMFVNILRWKDLFQLYIDGMPLLKLLQFQLSCFIQNLLPEVQLFLSKNNILIEFFCSQWFLTLFSFDFSLDFFAYFINQLLLFGPQFIIQLSLSLIDYVSKDLLSKQSMEEAMDLLKDFQRDKDLPIKAIFERAFEFDQVTQTRLFELEQIFKTNKNKKRVLFVKDHDLDITYLKTLPNLPDDEIMTECNVEDDSDSDHEKIDKDKLQEEFSPSVNALKKRQINNSFYLNNHSALDQKSGSSLGNSQDPPQKLSLKELIDESLDIKLVIDQGTEEQTFSQQVYFDEVMYQTQDCKRETRNKGHKLGLSTTSNIKHMFDYQAQEHQNIDANAQEYVQNNLGLPKKFDLQQYSSNENYHSKQSSTFSADQYKIKRTDTVQQPKNAQEILNQMSQRRFIHSPSLDNLKSSFKLAQKRKSKISMILSPNSEDIIESEHKIASKNPSIDYQIRKLGNLQQLENHEGDNKANETLNSNNISNIEEFINELEYGSVFDRLQHTQRLTTNRKDLREELTERDSVKLSWAKAKPLNRDLQLQFEINKLGSHLNTPNFQQTNRSNTILQEKKINYPTTFEGKRSAMMLNKGHYRIQENQDPNQFITQTENYLKVSLEDLKHPLNYPHLQKQSSLDDTTRPQNPQALKQPVNNFQRFSATQKNPMFKTKKQEKIKNKIMHNWSANNQKEALEMSNKNNNIEDLIKSMKLAQNQQVTRQGKILNKILTMSNGQLSGGVLTSREEQGAMTQRNVFNMNIDSMDSSRNFLLQSSQNPQHTVLSPRTQVNNKQSQKLVVHQGDNFFEEGEMTTIVTPKESLQKGRTNQVFKFGQ